MTDERPDRDVAEAFDRLRSDATRVDTMDALRRVDGNRPRRWLTTALPVAGLAAVAIALVLVFAGGSSDQPLDVAVGSESATTASEPEAPASETPTTASEPEAPASETPTTASEPAATTSETPTTASEPAATTSETPTTAGAALAGTSWVLVEGSTAIDRIDLGPGWPVTAEFDGGSITGTAACNQYGADYALLEGSPGDPTIEIGEIEQTEMFCSSSGSGDPMEAESAYLFALAEVEEWLLRVDRTELILRGPGVELRFEARAETGADGPVGSETVVVNVLAETSWMLFEGRGPAGEVQLNEQGFSLLFGGDSVFGDTGCNPYGALVRVVAPSIELGPIEVEQAGCGDITELEYLAALDDVDRFDLSGIELVLSGPESELRFVSMDHDLMPVGDLLDSRRMDPIIVKGHLVYRGGSWIVCEQIDPAAPMRCGSRWIVVVNYDRVVDPHTDPPTGVNDAAFELAAANPAFVADGDVVYTPRPQLLLVENLGEGRYAVPEFPAVPEEVLLDLSRVVFDLNAAASAATELDTLPLGDLVVLGLGDRLTVTRTAAELADRSAWELDLEAFRGRVGPFSALDLLSSVSEGSVLAGRHNHCASPPTPIPIELQDLFQLSVQPLEIDGCLEWFTVDVFIDDDGRVIGVTLDLWEP